MASLIRPWSRAGLAVGWTSHTLPWAHPKRAHTDYLGPTEHESIPRAPVNQGCVSGKTLQQWAERAVRLVSPPVKFKVAFSVRESAGGAGDLRRMAELADEQGGCWPAGDRCCPLRSGHSWPRCGPSVAPQSPPPPESPPPQSPPPHSLFSSWFQSPVAPPPTPAQ